MNMKSRLKRRKFRPLLLLAVASLLLLPAAALPAQASGLNPDDTVQSSNPAPDTPELDAQHEPNAALDSDSELNDEPGGQRSEKKHPHMHKHSMHLLTDAASIIGIEPDALKKELKAGKSIAEVAEAKGIKEADLTSKLIEAKMKKIDEAVKSGKWTAEKADRIKERLPEQLKAMIHHKGFHMKRQEEKQKQ